MKRILINIIYVALTIIILTILYIFLIFNPNDYKDEITNYVSSKTKYDFTYNGDMEFKLIPQTKLIIPNIELFRSSPSGSKDMLMSISKAELSISLNDLIDNVIDVKNIMATDFEYYGINADDVLLKTYSLVKFSLYNGDHPNITKIKNMSAKANVSENIMYVNQIYIESEIMEASGSGTIDIITKTANFKMIGKIKEYNNIINTYRKSYPEELNGEELPIIISGELNNLSVSIDLREIAIKKVMPIKERVIDSIKEKVLEEINDKIKTPF